MFEKRMWLGIFLSVILLVFSISGFTAYYKYTQESGTNFYVGTADKADALEDTNEIRQILDDLVEIGFDGIHPIQPQCMDIGKVKEYLKDSSTL